MAAISRPYILTAGAADDIREIARYTDRQWGKQQREAYVAQLEKVATDLALGKGVFRERNDVYPGVRVQLAGHHFVFCLPRKAEPALILAVLHERMDLVARLTGRLP